MVRDPRLERDVAQRQGKPGIRETWATATPAHRIGTVAILAVVIAVIAFAVIPNLQYAFELGRRAVK